MMKQMHLYKNHLEGHYKNIQKSSFYHHPTLTPTHISFSSSHEPLSSSSLFSYTSLFSYPFPSTQQHLHLNHLLFKSSYLILMLIQIDHLQCG